MQIVITGASKGIGLGIAETFCDDKQGHTFFLCARNGAQLEELALRLRARFPRNEIFTFAADLSQKTEVLAFADFVLQQTASIDILVNNAGIFIPGNCHDESDRQLEKMISTNLYSAYYLTRALLPKMIQNQAGHIFNICSVAALKAYPNGGSYSISKFALSGFTQNLREELKEFHIKVTGVYPGATMTDSWAGVEIPENRIMEVSDIATMIYAAAHLSPQADVEDIVLRPQLGDL